MFNFAGSVFFVLDLLFLVFILLKLMFKLLDTNFSNQKYFLSKFECKEENLINDIISKFIEKYSDIEIEKEINEFSYFGIAV